MSNRIDISGQIFGTWKVIEFDGVDNNNSYWLCQCQCGEMSSIQKNSLIRKIKRSDGRCQHEDLSRDLTGLLFGEWTVLGRTENKKLYFDCECSCGNKESVWGYNLTNGKSVHCSGCGKRRNLLGMIFGKLEVVSFAGNKNGRPFWNCICECGNRKAIPGSSLSSGDSNSCGCLQKEHASKLSSEFHVGKQAMGKFNWYILDNNSNKIWCRSSFEVFYWNHFYHVKNYSMQYEPRTFILKDGKRYTPDFYFPEFDKYIEIKGNFKMGNGAQEQKIKEISKQIDISILFWEDIVESCNLRYSQSQTYFKRAEKLNIPIEEYLGNMMYL